MAGELLTALISVVLALTIAVSAYYFRLIRRARSEYEKARSTVEDVVMSFNRELRRETGKLNSIAYRIENNSLKIDAAIKRVVAVEERIEPIDGVMSKISENSSRLASELSESIAKLRDIESTREVLEKKIAELQEEVKRILVSPEPKAEPVIPIKREKAMAALTETEVAVLEMLTAEGAKTAPEIKERVRLSREHTARLMKKLYEEGYLERETEKIPFKYKVKKEMESLLKKPETMQT